MTSLRARIILITALVMLTALGGGGAGVYLWLRASARQEEQARITTLFRSTAASLEFEDGRLAWNHAPDPGLRLAVLSAQGRLLIGDAGLRAPAQSGTLVEPVLVAGEGCREAWGTWVPESDDDEDGIPSPLTLGIVVSVAASEQDLATLRWVLGLGGLVTTVVALLAQSLALHRVLSPHARLAEEIARLDWHQLGRRLSDDGLPAELVPVVARFNELLERLERAFGLARSFNAAAAHELRTPIAGLRATIEVARQAPGGGDPLGACLAIVLQMQSRLDNLLMAARLDAGQVQPRQDEVDVHDLLRGAWELQSERARERGLEAAWDLSGVGLAQADTEALRMVLSNLVDNAVSHAEPRGVITLRCASAGGWLTVAVENPGGPSPADAARVFDRHWQAASGGTISRHAGLGMFICRELTGLMGGRISAQVADGRFQVWLQIPAAGDFEYW